MQPLTAIRLEPKIRQHLDVIAKLLERPRAWLIKEAVQQYVEREACYLAQVQKGLDDVNAGRLMDHEDVIHRLHAKGFYVNP